MSNSIQWAARALFTRLSLTLALTCLLCPPSAQAQVDVPPSVRWQIDVVQDGRSVDHFSATTTVGQAYSQTHTRSVTHQVGCREQPAAQIDLSRAVTVSPTRVDAGMVWFSLDVQETLEEDSAPRTVEGCKLPPQPRQISANHPGLEVPNGRSASWRISDKDPALVYQVHADVLPAQ